MTGEEGGCLSASFFEAVADVGGEAVAVGEGVVQVGEVIGQSLPVGGGEGGVAAGQRLAVGHDRRLGGAGRCAAQGALRRVDAGDEHARMQVWVVAGDDAAQPDLVGDDLAVEDGMARELGEPGFGLRTGWAGQRRPVAIRADLGEVLASGEGVFGLDLVAEAGGAGA